MDVERTLRQLHERARRVPALARLAIISRLLLALAFVPTALVKVQGRRFTSLSPDTAIGGFFDAMYRSGGYWKFLGASQLVAGLLLLIPQTSLLGAIAFFPIILNIFVITVALEFTGTPVITGLMLLASVFLLCWDYHRLAAILWGADAGYAVDAPASLPRIERWGYAVSTLGAACVLFLVRGYTLGGSMQTSLALGVIGSVVGAGLVVSGWWTAARR
jgi:hypothetical protein